MSQLNTNFISDVKIIDNSPPQENAELSIIKDNKEYKKYPEDLLLLNNDNFHLNKMNDSNNEISSRSASDLNTKTLNYFNNQKGTVNNIDASIKAVKIKKSFIQNQKNMISNKNITILELEVIMSKNLEKGFKLQINKGNLENSLRNVKDEFTYFGYEINNKNKNYTIDYLLEPRNKNNDDKSIGKYFQIRYDNNLYKYYIKDLGNGYGTFIKLINEKKINNNLLINIGDSFIVFSFKKTNKEIITLQIFTGEQKCEITEFNSKNSNFIVIGRDISNDVYIEDKMISRKHCFIYNKLKEDNNCEWFIKDGNIEGKRSTNETWFYIYEETEIFDQMMFKTNHYLFKCICK